MPLKLNVGLSKKIGQPDYGSLGASCNVEVELESSLLHNDLDGFHERVRTAFVACRQAVLDELSRHASGESNGSGGGNAHQAANNYGGRMNGNGYGNGYGPANGQTNGGTHSNGYGNATGNGNGYSPAKSGGSSRRASAKQLDYINQLASQIRGLDVRKLGQLTQKMYSKPLADLSGMDASGLIDTLRAIKAGEIKVSDALDGAAA